MIRTSLRKNKKIIIIYLILLLIGIVTGIIYISKAKLDLYKKIIELINNKKIISFNFYHIILYLFTIFFTFIYISPLISFFNVFLEGFSIGLIISSLYIKKGLKSVLFSLIISILGKSIYILLIIILGIQSLKYIFKNITINNYLKKSLILFGLCFFNEFLIEYFYNKLCLFFSFLII